MRQTLSILLTLTVLLPALNKAWIIIDFKINQEYIAKVLCINKDNLQNTCNGKCHLKRQLKETEEKQIPAALKEKAELEFLLANKTKVSPYTNMNDPQIWINYNDSIHSSLLINNLFRPPEFN